jgi:acyl-CoA thioesterase-1
MLFATRSFRISRRFATYAIFLVLGLAATSAQARNKPNPALQPIEDRPGLPRVLLIGDSISIGYTLPVREVLAEKANVHRIPTNGGPTIRGLEQIDAWLGDSEWDVIHFNWGLHDLRRDDGNHQVSLDEYEKNMETLVTRLEKTGAKLIWASTTPVPAGSAKRTPGDEVQFNQAAARVMKKHGIATDDLYTFALPKLEKIQIKANVHFTPSGSKVLAGEVARRIEPALPKPKAP